MVTDLADSQVELESPFNTCIIIHQAACHVSLSDVWTTPL